MLKVGIGQCSLRGPKESNDDSYGVLIPSEEELESKGITAIIADGVSCSEVGKQASESCVKTFFSDYMSCPDSWAAKTAIARILTALNQWLYAQSHGKFAASRGFVSTLTGAIIKGSAAHVFHVGDSRIYLVRNGTIECLTSDHRAVLHDDRQVLTRAMGIDLHLDIDYRRVELVSDDLLIFTTDGIHDFLADADILKIANNADRSLDERATEITDTALVNNGLDNATCQILHIQTLGSDDRVDYINQRTRLPFPPALRAGMSLDQWQIIEEIHCTSRSTVYKVVDPETGREGALKAPSENFNDDPSYIDRFLREEWAAKRIQNDHVASAICRETKKQFLYYVTEYIDGQTLQSWIEKHAPAQITEVQSLMLQLVKAVRAFHRNEMLHQDLKPDNILIDRAGNVKIIDFGSVKIAGLEDLRLPIEHEHLLGTINYSAPEYFNRRPASTRSDIYSLGVICYEMLTGKLPYGERKSFVNPGPWRFLIMHEHNPLVPQWMQGAIKKAVALDPSDRYPSLSEFEYDLVHPNKAFLQQTFVPLSERNPLIFWKIVGSLSLLINVLLALFWIAQK